MRYYVLCLFCAEIMFFISIFFEDDSWFVCRSHFIYAIFFVFSSQFHNFRHFSHSAALRPLSTSFSLCAVHSLLSSRRMIWYAFIWFAPLIIRTKEWKAGCVMASDKLCLSPLPFYRLRTDDLSLAVAENKFSLQSMEKIKIRAWEHWSSALMHELNGRIGSCGSNTPISHTHTHISKSG